MTPQPLDLAFVVLHTSPLDEPGTKDAGGMNVVVLAQATELARLGHRVRLITRRSDPGQPDRIELAPGLSVEHLEAGPAELLPKGEHEALIRPFGEALSALLRARPADLIHAEHWYSGLAALPAARALDLPLVQSYHSIAAADDSPLSEGERPEARGRLEGERRLAREARLVVTVSEAERHTVLSRLGGAPERVRVVLPGVDADLFRPRTASERRALEARTSNGERPEVLVAGRLDPLKRFDLAIAAVAALDPDRRPVLRVVGAPPPDGAAYARSLRAAVAAAGMESTTVFEGSLSREELAERLRRASLVLVPSHSETYGLIALEAAAAGVPVIAAAAGGLREAVLDGETGVLQDSEDPEAWAAQIARLLADPAERERLGTAAIAYAQQRSWAASTGRLVSVYRELLGELQ